MTQVVEWCVINSWEFWSGFFALHNRQFTLLGVFILLLVSMAPQFGLASLSICTCVSYTL